MFRPVLFGGLGLYLMLAGGMPIWHRSDPAGRGALLALGFACVIGLRAWHVVTETRDRAAAACPASLYAMAALPLLTCATCLVVAWSDVPPVLAVIVAASLVRAGVAALAASVPQWRLRASWFLPRPPWCPGWLRPGGFASWYRAAVIR